MRRFDACLAVIAMVAISPIEAEGVDFVTEVRPILQQHCYACHSETAQKSGLRLDVKSAAFAGGDGYGPSIIAADVDESPLIQMVSSTDEDSRMPPEGEPLTAAQIDTLKRWVEEGAEWPDGVDLAKLEDRRDHWSFKTLTHPAVPETPNSDWSRNEIDRFVLASLTRSGLEPAPAADDLTWLRRVHLDLTGLPPTPRQVDQFLGDSSGNARARVVEALLDSPRYGERWGQHWLDVVRYADTDGFEVNTPRPNAWPYRDYVIAAFNNDTPYDQFIREQLAGDVLGQDAATGFLVTAAALLPGQIGQDDVSKRLARQDALAEIVINVGEAFLGLSIGCARCHDHKFDPISHRDYYSMQAFFSGVHFAERPLSGGGDGAMVFAGKFTEPEPTHLLARGDPEQPGERLAPAVVDALGDLQVPESTSDQQRRVTLAEWIASPENPLTARVMVNRLWQWHFGIGLVETSSDFGRAGARPSHPALLDWLAEEFIRSGWSVKHLQRLIVLSATYGQSSRIDPGAQAQDADDRLVWRFPARRLEAESIRDSMLAVSGRLDLKMGGPGFDLFQSRGGLSGFPPIESFTGDGLRRMIYAHKIRMERDAVFGAFDCPDAGQSTARRRQSTTPIQALNLFNSQFTTEQADAFAAKIAAEVGEDARAQIERVYVVALGRPPEAEEIDLIEPIVREHGLATLCRVTFNSNEFLFLP